MSIELLDQDLDFFKLKNNYENVLNESIHNQIPNLHVLPDGNDLSQVALFKRLIIAKNLLFQNAEVDVQTMNGNNRKFELMLYLYQSKMNIYFDAKYLSKYSETFTYFSYNDFPQVSKIKDSFFVYILFGEGYTPELIQVIRERKNDVQGNNIIILQPDEFDEYLKSLL